MTLGEAAVEQACDRAFFPVEHAFASTRADTLKSASLAAPRGHAGSGHREAMPFPRVPPRAHSGQRRGRVDPRRAAPLKEDSIGAADGVVALLRVRKRSADTKD